MVSKETQALEECREAARAYFRDLVGLMYTPGNEWVLAGKDKAATQAFMADIEPFLYPLIFGGGIEDVRPHLPGVARAIKSAGDLSEVQLLRAAARFFATMRRANERGKLAALPA